MGVSLDSTGNLTLHYRSCTRPVRSVKLGISRDGGFGPGDPVLWKITSRSPSWAGNLTVGRVPDGFDERVRLSREIPTNGTLAVIAGPQALFFRPSEIKPGEIFVGDGMTTLSSFEEFQEEADETCAVFD